MMTPEIAARLRQDVEMMRFVTTSVHYYGADKDQLADDVEAALNEIERHLEMLRRIKLHCLTTNEEAPCALGHVVRLCIDAGITEKLPELELLLTGQRYRCAIDEGGHWEVHANALLRAEREAKAAIASAEGGAK